MVDIDLTPPDFPEFEQGQQSERLDKIAKIHRLEPAWSLQKLLEADLNEQFIIDQVLIENQPAIIGGAFKTLKTTLLVMQALSLCSGEKFLGRYDVFSRKRVLFCSAESGKRKIRNSIFAVAKQMGISVAELRDSGFLQLSWWVPKVNSAEVMEYFMNEVDRAQAEIVMLDPLYQALDDQQASMILNGQQLASLCNYILDAGATPICCDHVKRSSENARNREPLELDDISGAGKAEYFRQWMLVSRRAKFAPEENRKPHELWLSIGGSEGHSSQLALDVVELFDDQGHMTIEVATQQRSEMLQHRQESSKDKKEQAKEKAFQEKLDKALGFFKSSPNELRVTADVKAFMSCSSDVAKSIVFHLENKKLIVKHPEPVRRGVNTCDAYHLPGALILNELATEGQEGQTEVVPLSPATVSDGAKDVGLEGQGQTPIGGCPSVPLVCHQKRVLKKSKSRSTKK
jgi:RecA-family ATPase